MWSLILFFLYKLQHNADENIARKACCKILLCIASRNFTNPTSKIRFLQPAMRDKSYSQSIECFHSRDYRPYWFTETKESICIKIEFNSQRFGLGHQHHRHFFVLGHQHGMAAVTSCENTLYHDCLLSLDTQHHSC